MKFLPNEQENFSQRRKVRKVLNIFSWRTWRSWRELNSLFGSGLPGLGVKKCTFSLLKILNNDKQ